MLGFARFGDDADFIKVFHEALERRASHKLNPYQVIYQFGLGDMNYY